LAPAITAFSPTELRRWAEDLGQPTFIGSSGRVFPTALKASPLLRAWLRRLDAAGVRFRLRSTWRGWADTGALLFERPDRTMETAMPDATVLALGGASWPRLGSDGAWAEILSREAVAIAPLRPANCGFAVAWSELFRTRFAGQPLKSVALSFAGERLRGEAMITAYGIEGGAVYALSAPLRQAIGRAGTANLSIDLRPDLDGAALMQRLIKAGTRPSLSTILRKAAGLSPVAAHLIREAAGPAVPREPARLAALLKAVPVRLDAPQPLDRAISTAGGVAFTALDDRFMLRAKPGIFVAGEMLDWEAPTGGYLLQACFATGRTAATGALAWLERARRA
ncbi:MAG TPA: TIGR03862 family flavoprotein, partial [Candidatus Sulfotelmatobacter sp.]|nr:TIGR03862 family flavoprotein [Candidatus Sulfotelmatobacter sp.]